MGDQPPPKKPPPRQRKITDIFSGLEGLGRVGKGFKGGFRGGKPQNPCFFIANRSVESQLINFFATIGISVGDLSILLVTKAKSVYGISK